MSGINKWVLRFIRFMVGLFIGFFVTISFVKDSIYEKMNMPWFPRVAVSGDPKVYSVWKIIILWLGIMIILLIVITLLARLIMTSESVSDTAIVLNVVADFLVGIPLAAAIWRMIEFILEECTNMEGMISIIIMLSVVYAFVYNFACVIIDIFYSPWILKPLKKKDR